MDLKAFSRKASISTTRQPGTASAHHTASRKKNPAWIIRRDLSKLGTPLLVVEGLRLLVEFFCLVFILFAVPVLRQHIGYDLVLTLL